MRDRVDRRSRLHAPVPTQEAGGFEVDRGRSPVRAVLAHECPWRFIRHLPTATQVWTLAKMGWLTLRGRASDAAETLLRSAYSYRDGGTAPFPRSGVGRAGKAQVRRWRTSATRSVSIRPRPISRRSRFPSCARTVPGAGQHVPRRRVTRGCHSRSEYASNRRGGPCCSLRCAE